LDIIQVTNCYNYTRCLKVLDLTAITKTCQHYKEVGFSLCTLWAHFQCSIGELDTFLYYKLLAIYTSIFDNKCFTPALLGYAWSSVDVHELVNSITVGVSYRLLVRNVSTVTTNVDLGSECYISRWYNSKMHFTHCSRQTTS